MTMRPILALCLAAMMALTAQAAAIARGMPGAAGYAELCTGTGPVMVAVDAEGQPLGHAHLCPDNAFLLLDAVAWPPIAVTPVHGWQRAAPASLAIAVHSPMPDAPVARGPPPVA